MYRLDYQPANITRVHVHLRHRRQGRLYPCFAAGHGGNPNTLDRTFHCGISSLRNYAACTAHGPACSIASQVTFILTRRQRSL